MWTLRRHRQLLARLCAAVLLLAALAPSVSRATAFARGDIAPWSVLCSAMGPSGGALANALSNAASSLTGDMTDDAERAPSELLHHCALCHLASDAPALPAWDAAAVPAPVTGRDGPPPLALHAPRPLHAWAAPPSQGPPQAH